MDRAEFLRRLREPLRGLPDADLADILYDYEEHFRIGMEKGRTEEELAASLGDPDELAREIRAIHLVKKAEHTASANNIVRAVAATIGLGLFNLIVVLVPFLILVTILATFFFIGVGFTLGGPVAMLLSPMPLMGITPLAAVFFAIGFAALGLLIIIGDYYVARLFYTMTIRYLKWNLSVIRGTDLP